MPGFKKILKVDESISLCLPDPEMAEELFRLIDRQRAHLGRWLVWVDNTHCVEDSQVFLKEAALFNMSGKRLTTLIKYNHKVVGSIGFIELDTVNKKGEIGYWISQNMQGQGIITKACKKLIEYAFRHLDVHRIVIKMDSQNARSKAIAARMGFTHEGTLRHDRFRNGTFRNTELYSLLKDEWK
jgi:ribosomal-protein-serine acetyltransferase